MPTMLTCAVLRPAAWSHLGRTHLGNQIMMLAEDGRHARWRAPEAVHVLGGRGRRRRLGRRHLGEHQAQACEQVHGSDDDDDDDDDGRSRAPPKDAEHASLCTRVLFQRTTSRSTGSSSCCKPTSVGILVSGARMFRSFPRASLRGAPSALIHARELLPARLCVRRAAPAAVGAWRSATAAQRHSRHDGQEGRCEEGRCHHRCPALHSHGRMRLHRLAPASLSSPHPLPVSPSPPSQ